MFKRILYPTAFEEFSMPILHAVSCLKPSGLEEIILLHVIETDGPYATFDKGYPDILEPARVKVETLREAAARQLESFAEYLLSRGIRVRTRVTIGQLIPEIMKAATDTDSTLIIAGRQKRDILGELFVGSTTDRIIRKSKVPVLVAKYHTLQEIEGEVCEHFCVDMFSRILYPTDWSACAERARQTIRLLHKAGASELVLLHIVEDLPYDDIPRSLWEKTRQDLVERNKEKLEVMKREFAEEGFRAKTRVIQGKPTKVILETASEEDVSLIVMGSHGRGFIEGILWGSVSQRVVEYSEKPVLVVK